MACVLRFILVPLYAAKLVTPFVARSTASALQRTSPSSPINIVTRLWLRFDKRAKKGGTKGAAEPRQRLLRPRSQVTLIELSVNFADKRAE